MHPHDRKNYVSQLGISGRVVARNGIWALSGGAQLVSHRCLMNGIGKWYPEYLLDFLELDPRLEGRPGVQVRALQAQLWNTRRLLRFEQRVGRRGEEREGGAVGV